MNRKKYFRKTLKPSFLSPQTITLQTPSYMIYAKGSHCLALMLPTVELGWPRRCCHPNHCCLLLVRFGERKLAIILVLYSYFILLRWLAVISEMNTCMRFISSLSISFSWGWDFLRNGCLAWLVGVVRRLSKAVGSGNIGCWRRPSRWESSRYDGRTVSSCLSFLVVGAPQSLTPTISMLSILNRLGKAALTASIGSVRASTSTGCICIHWNSSSVLTVLSSDCSSSTRIFFSWTISRISLILQFSSNTSLSEEALACERVSSLFRNCYFWWVSCSYNSPIRLRSNSISLSFWVNCYYSWLVAASFVVASIKSSSVRLRRYRSSFIQFSYSAQMRLTIALTSIFSWSMDSALSRSSPRLSLTVPTSMSRSMHRCMGWG